MIDPLQFREWVVKPALVALGLNSPSAVNLLMLTVATESAMGKYLRQKGTVVIGGYGVYQMEVPTYHDIYDRIVAPSAAMKAKIKLYCGYEGKPSHHRLITDLSFATIMARLFYYSKKEALPNATDNRALATYYKKYYNTALGKNTVAKAMANYEKYAKALS